MNSHNNSIINGQFCGYEYGYLVCLFYFDHIIMYVLFVCVYILFF